MNDYTKFDLPFIEQVKGVLAEADKHKYSVSRVYGAYNKAFNKKDKQQTCSSCLRNRVKELRKWYEGYTKFEAEQKKMGFTDPFVETGVDKGTKEGDTQVEAVIGNPESYVAPGVRAFNMEGDTVIHFDTGNSEGRVTNGTKGIALYEDGTKVKAGTYKTVIGDEIAVQPGGKATFKENEDLL